MKTYPLHKDFAVLKHFCAPISAPMLPLINFVLGLYKPSFKRFRGVEVKRVRIPRPDGTQLSALMFFPRVLPADKKLSCLLYLHGGGFVMSAAPQHYRMAAEFVSRLCCAVLLPDYSLAPKHPFPAALDDAYVSLCWLHENAAKLGIDSDRIAVGGDSAGGCLAAGIAQKARDCGGPEIKIQLLLYPVLDRTLSSNSMKEFPDSPVWNAKLSRKMWEWYLPQEAQNELYASPAAAQSLKGLPPAYIECAQYDSLRDEAAAYAEALKKAGVPTEFYCVSGAPHGYDSMANSSVVKHFVGLRMRALESALR